MSSGRPDHRRQPRPAAVADSENRRALGSCSPEPGRGGRGQLLLQEPRRSHRADRRADTQSADLVHQRRLAPVSRSKPQGRRRVPVPRRHHGGGEQRGLFGSPVAELLRGPHQQRRLAPPARHASNGPTGGPIRRHAEQRRRRPSHRGRQQWRQQQPDAVLRPNSLRLGLSGEPRHRPRRRHACLRRLPSTIDHTTTVDQIDTGSLTLGTGITMGNGVASAYDTSSGPTATTPRGRTAMKNFVIDA